jgi:hypothetical protein
LNKAIVKPYAPGLFAKQVNILKTRKIENEE